jgi:predicted PurR-regulated permease PerM
VESIQILVGNFIEPRVTGKVLNLSPLGVILALSFWGIIWGVLGMVISVPITSISVIVMSYFPNTRFVAIWLSETGEVGDLPHMEDG